MTEMHVASLLVAVLGSAVFASFTWGTVKHFVWEGSGAGGAWLVSMVSSAVYVLFMVRVAFGTLSKAWPAACLLFLAGWGLWYWALKRTRIAPPTLAFTEDSPKRLYDDGPYRWVRHPFYSAYLVFWVGTALALQGVAGWAGAIALMALYRVAARQEEGKFARSPLADQYTSYAARTGMFIPRLLLAGHTARKHAS